MAVIIKGLNRGMGLWRVDAFNQCGISEYDRIDQRVLLT